MRVVYLLHLFSPLKHARHYLGSTNDLPTRIADHQSGQGARLLAVIKMRQDAILAHSLAFGIPQLRPVVPLGQFFTIARIWAGGRGLERKLKDSKSAPRLCPLCRKD